MPHPLATVKGREVVAMLLSLALAGLAGCADTPGRVPDSHNTFDRTFDVAAGAMADQKMAFSLKDRRNGVIVAELKGDSITATLQPQYDGTIRVLFKPQGDSHTDAGLLKRVVDSYNLRMSQAKLIPDGLL
jgi:hypothetical protein